MEKNQKIVCFSIVAIVILTLLAVWGMTLWKKDTQTVQEPEYQEQENAIQQEEIQENETDTENNTFVQPEENQAETQDTQAIDELKEETGTTGNTEIYQVEEEYDGRKVLAVKPSIQTKVAFAGMMKHAQPTMEEAEKIANEQLPKNAGVWIAENSRTAYLTMLQEVLESTYAVDDQGYLKVVNKEKQNQYDKKLEQAIQSDKQYLIDISSTCYTVDQLTGEIGPYLYSELDPYQTYHYLQDSNRMVIFLTENAGHKLTNTEIIHSVIDLI